MIFLKSVSIATLIAGNHLWATSFSEPSAVSFSSRNVASASSASSLTSPPNNATHLPLNPPGALGEGLHSGLPENIESLNSAFSVTSTPKKLRKNPTLSKTILVAEENWDDVLQLQQALSKLILEVSLQVVSDGQEALQYLVGRGRYANRDRYPLPNLIVANIKTSSVSGVELLAWVKQQPELADIPFVLMSHAQDSKNLVHVFALGVSAYFIKPTSPDIWLHKVKNLVRLI